MLTINYSVYNQKFSPEEIKAHGQDLISTVIKKVRKDKSYQRSSRFINFSKLKKDYNTKKVTVMGIVTEYHVYFCHRKRYPNYVMFYLLLKDVHGISLNNHDEPITDHLWLDINIMEYLHPTAKISLGDTITVQGFIKEYRGYLGGYKHRIFFGQNYRQHHHDTHGNIYGTKLSIKATNLVKCGYPIIENKKIKDIISYYHGNNFIIYSDNSFSECKIGNEIRAKDLKRINDGHYLICNFLLYLVNRNIRHKGMNSKFKHHAAPKNSYIAQINEKKNKSEEKNVFYLILALNYAKHIASIYWTRKSISTENVTKIILCKSDKKLRHAIRKLQISYKEITNKAYFILLESLRSHPDFAEMALANNRYYN